VLDSIADDDSYRKDLTVQRNKWGIRGTNLHWRRQGLDRWLLERKPVDPGWEAIVERDPEMGTIESPAATWSDRRRMKSEWRQSSTFAAARESFRGVIANQMACCLADAAVDLEKAATMTDDELLKVPRMGLVTLANLRRFFAEREQCEEAA
jgi:hypothetical protein